MAAPNTIDEAIEQVALGPKRVRIGQQEVEQPDIDQLVKAAQYGKSSTAAGKSHFGLRFTKLVPPGAG